MHELSAIQKLLPQKGVALAIDHARVDSPDQATGYFLVRHKDPRIIGHYDTMSAGLLAEFAHQTADFLMMQEEKGSLPVVKSSNIIIYNAALPGDSLVCVTAVNMRNGRKISFSSVILRTNNNQQELIAKVAFTRTAISKRTRERWERKTLEALPTWGKLSHSQS